MAAFIALQAFAQITQLVFEGFLLVAKTLAIAAITLLTQALGFIHQAALLAHHLRQSVHLVLQAGRAVIGLLAFTGLEILQHLVEFRQHLLSGIF